MTNDAVGVFLRFSFIHQPSRRAAALPFSLRCFVSTTTPHPLFNGSLATVLGWIKVQQSQLAAGDAEAMDFLRNTPRCHWGPHLSVAHSGWDGGGKQEGKNKKLRSIEQVFKNTYPPSEKLILSYRPAIQSDKGQFNNDLRHTIQRNFPLPPSLSLHLTNQ